MHKTTRQIWATSSSSPCFFCDFQLLVPRSTPVRTNSTRAVSVRAYSRNIATSRIQPQHQLEQQQRLASCLRVFGISTYHQQLRLSSLHQLRQFRSQKQAFYTYTVKTLSKGGASTRYSTSAQDKTPLQSQSSSSLKYINTRSDGLLALELVRLSALNTRMRIDSRISLEMPRFLSTSTSPSFTPDPEANPLSSRFTGATISVSSVPPSEIVQPRSNILDPTAVVTETPPSPDFQSLFPDTPASFIDPSSRNPFATIESKNVPWRNSSMSEGTELEESLRRSVYQRDPVGTWWPLYEQVATQWRDKSHTNSTSGQATALVRADFARFIHALKLSPTLSRTSERIERLDIIFDDFHCAINTQKSNVKVYTSFLDTLHFWNLEKLIPEWISRMKSKISIPLSSSTETSAFRESPQEQYHDLMRVLVETSQVDAALKCLEELKASNSNQLRVTIKAYDAILEGLIKRKDSVSASKILEEMKDQGFPPELTTFNILLRGHLANRDAHAVQRVLESLLLTDIRPDIYTFNLLMSGYLNMGETELVNGFYKGLGEYGLVPNSKTYRILMKAHLRQGQIDQVVDLFSKLKDSPRPELHPGSEDYCVLLQALTSHDRMPDALKVLRELVETGNVPVTTQIYNVFLTQYARGGQTGKARRILDKIISKRLPLVDGSFNPLIRAYLEKREYDKVEEIAELMKRHGIQPSRATFNIMINATKSSGNLSGAMALYEHMIVEGVDPDVWTYNTLLDILIGKLTPAQDSIRSKGYSGEVSDEQIQEYVPKIEMLLQEMKSRRVNPDVVTFGKLIHQYVLLQDIEQAETLFHEMTKSGISPNGFAINTLMNGFTLIEEMDKAVELFRKMRKYGVEADATTFTTLIKGYANTKQLTLAQDFANSMQQQSPRIRMDRYCLNTLMQLAQKSRQPGMALDFFEMMRGRGIEPDKITYTILINALGREFADTRGSDQGNSSGFSAMRKAQSRSYAQVVESLLEVIQQDEYPLHHSQITTVISAYFRLGRPLAAIEFFKTSYWRASPKISTRNCGAMFHGLLASEHGRRYDGIVLNLYSRMFVVTKERIRAASSKSSSQRWKSKPKSVPNDLPKSSRNDLPPLDLITMNILFQSFSRRQNWKIVIQLWEDLETIGAEKLYPFTMPLEFLGWAAQAYHAIPDPDVAGPYSQHQEQNSPNGHYDGLTKRDKTLRKGDTHAERSEKLLTRLWKIHPYMAVEWSTKIYGQNIFESYKYPRKSTLSASRSRARASSTKSNLAQSSLMTSYLTDDDTLPKFSKDKPLQNTKIVESDEMSESTEGGEGTMQAAEEKKDRC